MRTMHTRAKWNIEAFRDLGTVRNARIQEKGFSVAFLSLSLSDIPMQTRSDFHLARLPNLSVSVDQIAARADGVCV